MPRTLVILNPAARGRKAQRFIETIAALGKGTDLYLTNSRGDAERIVSEAAACGDVSKVIAAGGDGTVNEVVNGIGQSNVTLGILPVGTMNVFALELGLPIRDLERCWRIIEDGHVRRIDLGHANDRYFVQLGGIGLDAQVVLETDRDFRRTFGPLTYLVSAAQIAARRPPRLLIEGPERTSQGSFVLVGNGKHYGGPVVFFRDARIDDGLLDVMVFKNLSNLDMIRYLQSILFGNPTDLADVEYFQTPRLTVRSETEGVPVEVDGEVIGSLPVKIRFARRKLRVLAPEPKHGH